MRPDLYLKNGTVVVANGVIAQIVADIPTIDTTETSIGFRLWARNPPVICTTRM